MTDLPTPRTPPGVPEASPLFLRESEVRRGIELLYFGYTDLIREADARLAKSGLGRAHHRALYFIARRPGLSVGDLLGLLNITKQSLSRVLGDLTTRELASLEKGKRDRRQRLITLTDAGLRLEHELFELLRLRMAGAYAAAGQDSVSGFWQVLADLLPSERRDEILIMQAADR
ncbi:MarR family transcriptional regulator [Pacificimonas sp. WHA3]|uniref:MarR family transcriptional regulator n=1 Tax=Pacificimonas pallii TaxID=2827236 RepID=A0ABS6SER7_9SPHN|nr:MarR family transcriptional regulator [Pacificimonas pallii]MBV7256898.1 MarR family transcriptional regulator [Pacificimonas pallii]